MSNENQMEETSDLLIKWGFQKYIDVYKENEVDVSALQLLDDVQVRELIPAIGPQAKFKKILVDWKVSLKKAQNDDNLDHVILLYGDSVDGLTLSLTSPIQSLPGSPSFSSRSASSASVSSHTHYDLTLLLESTPDGKLLLKHNQENTLGEQYRKILVRAISKEIFATILLPLTSVTNILEFNAAPKFLSTLNITIYLMATVPKARVTA